MIKLLKYFLILLFITISVFSFPQLAYKNNGVSKSNGSVSNGKLKNAYKLPYSGENFSYFSPFSYYILGRVYVHSSVFKTVIDSYKKCEKECPGTQFKLMECSNKKGGKMFPHQTHQNGLSIDFMTPLVKNGKQHRFYDHFGIFRYILNFDNSGNLKLNKNVSIDFETMAKHILILDKEARKNGLKVKKVILKTELKDELFNTKTGKLLKRRGIYFVRSLPEKINKLHDDHYHIDFGFL
ncbi:MAG: penicillin-insensitive murein endopeptidase [Bacteroidota bacterium]